MDTRRGAHQLDVTTVGDDVWRVVASFLVSNEVRPRALNEEPMDVDAEVGASLRDTLLHLESQEFQFKDNDHEGNERARLRQLRAIRSVCRAFRETVTYATLRQLTLRSDWCLRLPADLGTAFAGVESVSINARGGFGPTRSGSEIIPSALRSLPRLRELQLEYTTFSVLPSWFRDLALDQFTVCYPVHREGADWDCTWEADERALPPSLSILRHSPCNTGTNLEHVRRLPHLCELQIGFDTWPTHWFAAELGQLRRFRTYCCAITAWAPHLAQMRLEAVCFDVDQPGDTQGSIEAALDLMVGPGSVCGETLRELRLRGQGLLRVPDSFRPLRLRSLNLEECNIRELPQWIGELPLVVLNLSRNEKLRALPASLRTVTTLRLLYLEMTSLEGGRRFVLVDGQYGSLTDREIQRRNSELYGISEALPDLRLRLHTECGDYRECVGRIWWHARCGAHWTDPRFFS